MGAGIWLAALGGVLLGQTIIVLTLYWRPAAMRWHVLAISSSYLLLVVLAMQPALQLKLSANTHVAVAVVAYLLGCWALWALVPRGPGRGETSDAGVYHG